MAERVQDVTPKVLDILRRFPKSRSDDKFLIRMLFEEHYNIVWQPFCEVVMNRNLPSFEAIRRARQKIQADHEELRAVELIENARIENQKEYLDYAMGVEP